LGHNFLPVRLGAGDWVDSELFSEKMDGPEIYDFVMIANWLKWKRHALFFKALSRIKEHICRVAVIGYPIEGRTLQDVKHDCCRYGVCDCVDFFERIPYDQVASMIRRAKAGILLSKEEGANRGIYECFFSNVPIILSSSNRGVNRDHINSQTGMLADDEELADVMRSMLQNYREFSPRQWALAHTGYINATRILNDVIKVRALACGEPWTQDIFTKYNAPHARYRVQAEQDVADQVIDEHVGIFLRT